MKRHIWVPYSEHRRYGKACDLLDAVRRRLVDQLPEFGTAAEFEPWANNVYAAIDLIDKHIKFLHRDYDASNREAERLARTVPRPCTLR